VALDAPCDARVKPRPFPLRATWNDGVGGKLAIVKPPANGPDCVGEKTTWIEQLAPGASTSADGLSGHVVPLVVAKYPVVARVNAFRATPPLLVTVTPCGGLVPATPQGPKLIVAGSAEIPAGAKPEPVKVTV
jgi:hypothetical protein